MGLTKDEILGADDRRIETLPVPEWGGDVFIRVMSGSDRDGFEEATTDANGNRRLRQFRARLCSLVLCDEGGKRLFAEQEIADLGEKSAAALDRVMMAALRLNGLSGDAVEELAKNSKAAPSG